MANGLWTTRDSYQAQTKVLEAAFTNASNAIPLLYPKLFNVWDTDPTRSFASVLPIAELGLLHQRSAEGAAFATDCPTELIPVTFPYQTYGLSSYITEEALLEDPLHTFESLPAMLANSEKFTKDLLVWNTLNLAFSNLVPGSDGLPLCATNHPIGPKLTSVGIRSLTGQTFSNSLVTAPLNPESLRQAEILFEELITDKGMPDRRTPKYLVCSPQLAKTAQEVIGTPKGLYTNTGTINTACNTYEIMPVRYLTSPTAWFLASGTGDFLSGGDTNSLVVGYKWQNRVKSWYEEPTGNFGIRTSMRLTYGFINWRGIVGSLGS